MIGSDGESVRDHLRVFVSFSSREELVADFVRLLWVRLQDQPLSVFNYETLKGEIVAGRIIEAECKKEIEAADFFFAVVSEESLRSPWTRMEVAHALGLNRRQFVYPIVVASNMNWDGPYEKLKEIKSITRVDSADIEASRMESAADHVVFSFCRDQGIHYFPPGADMHRLPLRRRLFQEVAGNKALREGRKAQQIEALFECCDDFKDSYLQDDLELALEISSEIVRRLRKHFPGAHLYYPRIVESIVKIKMSIANQEALRAISKDLQRIIDEGNKWTDANVFGLLGYISLLLDQAPEALDHYRKAEGYLTTKDPAIYHNKLLAAVLADERTEIHRICRELQPDEEGLLVSHPRDSVRLTIVGVIARSYLGQPKEALDALGSLDDISEDDFDLVRQLLDQAHSLAAQSRNPYLAHRVSDLMVALEPIAQGYSRLTWVSLIQRQAWLLYELGEVDAAASRFEGILRSAEFSASVRLLVDGALIFLGANRPMDALECLERALEQRDLEKQFPAASRAEFEYYRGLAAWLCGNDEIARDSYLRSGDATAGKWYGDESWWWVARQNLCRRV